MNNSNNNVNKNNYASPYANSMQQYPSQSEDFLAFDIRPNQPKRERFGGTSLKRPQQCVGDAQSTAGGGNEKIPPFYRNQNPFGDGGGNRGGGGGYNRGRNFNNRYFGNNRGNSRRGGPQGDGNFRFFPKHVQNYRRGGNDNDNNQEIGSTQKSEVFFHPSMLEDPWEGLINRRRKIREGRRKNDKADSNDDTSNSESAKSDEEETSEKISNATEDAT